MLKRSKAFVSFDFLFGTIPILLIVSYAVIFSSFLENKAAEKIEKQILFDKLVSISNYAVKNLAKSEGMGFPNKKIDPNLMVSDDFSQFEGAMRTRLRLNSLSIGFEKGEGTCIYRLVLFEPTNEIKKLYFCGD